MWVRAQNTISAVSASKYTQSWVYFHHLVVRIRLHQRDDPPSDGFASMHFSEDVFNVYTIIGKQISECIVIGGQGAVIADSLKVLVLVLQFL
jgi:hypothetical protein